MDSDFLHAIHSSVNHTIRLVEILLPEDLSEDDHMILSKIYELDDLLRSYRNRALGFSDGMDIFYPS